MAFRESNELFRAVSHVEGIGVRRDTYLDELLDESTGESDACLGVFLVEPKPEWVGCFVVGVEGLYEVLAKMKSGTVWS